MSLFQLGNLSLASGQKSGFKIECDALTDDDWACLAWLLEKRVPIFGEARGIPRGGLPFAQALAPYASDYATRVLLVDDVWTTGGSMRQAREEAREELPPSVSISCAVAFARTQCPSWVVPIFQMVA